MATIGIKHPGNPRIFDWQEFVDAIYHNLGSRASELVVHLSLDIKDAQHLNVGRRPHYELGIVEDLALVTDLLSDLPDDQQGDIQDYVFLRAFTIGNERLHVSPMHIWVDGQMVGGIDFPQYSDPDDYCSSSPFKEVLADYVCYRPEFITELTSGFYPVLTDGLKTSNSF